ncbi:MAG TPA: hypothetical protein VGG39_03650 [Polyangiaceae bacterium]|jgi:hypothetical protein
MSGDENLWYVKTPDGDVHRVTLDQLDEAFQAGRIDENVMVLAAGSTRWAKLGELAGLDTPVPPAPAMPNSLRPVSMDLSLDLDDDAFKKKPRKGLAIVATLGILAVLGGVLASNRMHLSSGGDVAAAAAPPATTPPSPPPVTAATPDPAPPPPVATTTAPPADSAAIKLTDKQKAKLAAADKALEAKAKAHRKSRGAGGGAAHSAKYKSQGFTTGGNKFDPLNANM